MTVRQESDTEWPAMDEPTMKRWYLLFALDGWRKHLVFALSGIMFAIRVGIPIHDGINFVALLAMLLVLFSPKPKEE